MKEESGFMNPYIKTGEVVISLPDLAKHLLQRAGWILLAALIGALAVGGWRFYSQSQTVVTPALAAARIQGCMGLKPSMPRICGEMGSFISL